MHSLLLYALPLLCRSALVTPNVEWWRVSLSLVPLLVVLPSLWLPRCFVDREREHVARHGVYALSFTIAMITSVRWDTIETGVRGGEEWAIVLTTYLFVGSVTLWWFCISHMLENRLDRTMYTHQGDVAVLPLTLVAIATFAHTVPDEAFQFSRAIVFYVPVVVAWATLHFIAYNEFAIHTTTTYDKQGFLFLAHSGLVVASVQLCLLELRSPSIFYQFFPFVAALLCQVTTRPDSAPLIRPARMLGTLAMCGACGVGVGRIIAFRTVEDVSHPLLLPLLVGVVGCTVVATTVPLLSGRRWVVPGTLYATLVTIAVMDASPSFASVRISDVAAVAAAYYLGLGCVHVLASPTWTPRPPVDVPTQAVDYTPQIRASWWSPSRILGALGRFSLPSRRTYDETTHARFYDRIDDNCADFAVGVWWMKGNTFPMDLVCVHRLAWSADGTAVRWDRTDTTRRSTLGGFLLQMAAWFGTTRIVSFSRDWIRTDGWLFGPLRLLPDHYWLYRVSDDEMMRIVYDAHGRVVWQYRMLRISRRRPEDTTPFFREYLHECRGRGYWLSL